jgi:hypothetical protein
MISRAAARCSFAIYKSYKAKQWKWMPLVRIGRNIKPKPSLTNTNSSQKEQNPATPPKQMRYNPSPHKNPEGPDHPWEDNDLLPSSSSPSMKLLPK